MLLGGESFPGQPQKYNQKRVEVIWLKHKIAHILKLLEIIITNTTKAQFFVKLRISLTRYTNKTKQ